MAKEKTNLIDSVGIILRHPGFATVITVFIIVTGLWGSIFSVEIRKAFPFYTGKGPVSWEACVFWVLVVVSASTFFFRERSVAQEQNRLQKLAEARTDNLQELQELTLKRADEFERLIRTLPPSNFLEVFSEFFGGSEKVMEAAFTDRLLNPKPRAIVEKSARQILRMIATLAQKFDGDHPGVEYAANVMLFKPSKGMSLEEAATIRSQLLFCDETVSVEQLKGTLQLDVELSTTAADPTASPDPAMQPIALPIPKTPKNGLRYKVFPGAPLAFIEREPDVYTDTAALPKWAEEYGDFTREVINSMAKYFAQSTVRSFISLPLFGIRDDGSDEETVDPLAVLNVHSSQAGLLKERGEPLTHFVSIIRPFRVFLVQLLSALHPDAPSMKPDIKIDKSTSDMKDEAS